jgi:solute:Na+ symporter, SSS family
MPTLHWIDYSIIGGYLLVSLVIGVRMSKRAGKNTESYFLGGRSLPWWATGISLAATSFASDTPLVVTEMIRGRGLQRLWWLFAGVFALVVAVYLFSRLWRRLEAMTDAEFCELRYDGRSAALLRVVRAFMSGVVGNLITMAWVTLGMASIITVTMPVEKWTAITIAMTVTLLYTVFGGFFSAVLTDVIQFVIAVVAMVLLAVIAVGQFGGMPAVLEAVRTHPGYGDRTLSLFPDFANANLDLAAFVILIGLWWTDTGGYVMQRLSACRHERDAVKAMLFFTVWQAIRPWMWVVVALVSIALFPVLPAGNTDTQAYPMVMQSYLGIGLRGLLITAFAAAFMSTMSTQLNWGASYLVRDGYCRFIRPQASDRESVLVSRLMTVLLAVAGVGLTPLLTSITQAWEFLALLMAGSGVIGVLRWFWWRLNAWSELVAVAAGLTCAMVNLALMGLAPDLSVFGTPWVELRFEIKLALFTTIALSASAVATYVTPPVAMAKLKSFNRKVRPGGWWGPVAAGEDLASLPPPVLTPRTLLDVLGGLALCLGTTVGIGFAILQQPLSAGISWSVALAGAWSVRAWFRRAGLSTARHHPPTG